MLRYPAYDEWFVILGLIGGYGLIFLLPQKLPRSVSFLMMLFGVSMALGMDHSIGVPPFDLYDTNINPRITFTDLLTWPMYAPFAYLFVYLIQRWKVKGLGIPLYILVWTVFAVGFEALSAQFGVFQYKGWTLRNSFMVYLVVQMLTVIFFQVLMKVFIRLREV